jgi:chromosome segregation ATPase
VQTYYETIQDQSTELTDYKKQIEDMQKKHDDSMLIATNSVEASQRREADLLNNIEELEGELADLQKEKKEKDQEVRTLQGQLNAMTSNSQQVEGDTVKQNKQLAMEINELRLSLDTVTKEKEQILDAKLKVERILVDRVLGEDHSPDEMIVKTKPKQSRWRYLLYPWTLLRRR